MATSDAFTSAVTTLPKVWAGAGSLLAFAAFTCSFWAGLCSVVVALAMLGAKAYIEERQLQIKLAAEDRKRAHEASEAEKERKHKAREGDKDRKKEIALALIAAQAHGVKPLSLVATRSA